MLDTQNRIGQLVLRPNEDRGYHLFGQKGSLAKYTTDFDCTSREGAILCTQLGYDIERLMRHLLRKSFHGSRSSYTLKATDSKPGEALPRSQEVDAIIWGDGLPKIVVEIKHSANHSMNEAQKRARDQLHRSQDLLRIGDPNNTAQFVALLVRSQALQGRAGLANRFMGETMGKVIERISNMLSRHNQHSELRVLTINEDSFWQEVISCRLITRDEHANLKRVMHVASRRIMEARTLERQSSSGREYGDATPAEILAARLGKLVWPSDLHTLRAI